MNSDESFEDQLRQQTLRPIPGEWKRSLLSPEIKTGPSFSWLQFWISIFRPYRYAYGTIALVWIVIAFFRMDTPTSSSSYGVASVQSLPTSTLMANWLEKQRFLAAQGSNPMPPENLTR